MLVAHIIKAAPARKINKEIPNRGKKSILCLLHLLTQSRRYYRTVLRQSCVFHSTGASRSTLCKQGCPRPFTLLRNRNPFRLAGSYAAICSAGHDVVPKTAIGVQTFLLDDHFVAQKRHGDLALRRVARNERRHIAFDCSLADRFAETWVTTARHPLTIELHLKLVMTQCENSKVVAVIFIDAVDLGGGDDVSRRLAACHQRSD
jgi:hypothetical protein